MISKLIGLGSLSIPERIAGNKFTISLSWVAIAEGVVLSVTQKRLMANAAFLGDVVDFL